MEYSKEIRSQMIKEFSCRIFRGESFSLTFDEWTSIKNRRYININVHSACKKFWNLGLTRIHGSLPAEKCVELVDKKLVDNGLSLNKNIVCITTDGASVMTKVGRLINAKQQLCFAHGIQLAVIKVLYKCKNLEDQQNLDIQYEEDPHDESTAAEFDEDYLSIIDEYTDEDLCYENGLTITSTESENPNDYMITDEQIGPLIDKIRKVVSIFRRSPAKNDKILQKYIKGEFGKELVLILDSKTRWNSLLNMLERFDKIKNCIRKALIDMNSEYWFSDNEFSLLSTVISGLLPVKLTLEACCRQDATLLSADAAFQFMFKELTKQNNPFSNELKNELKIRILQRRTELTDVLQYLHNCNSSFEDEDKENTDIMHNEMSKIGLIKVIVNLLERLHQTEDAAAIAINENDDSEIISSDSEHEQEAESLLTMKEKLEMEISKRIKINETVTLKQKNTKDLNKVIRQELCYFEAENIRGKYLNLVYNSLLSIPPTSVESERAFSAAGILCTKIRSRLGDKSLDKLTFLRAYFNSLKK